MDETPPTLAFLKLLAHDVRWQLIQTLSLGDFRVQELVEATHQPMNLVSYHLKHLKAQQVLSVRRSDADGRDMYYSLNREQLAAMYAAVGEVLQVGDAAFAPNPHDETRYTGRVLFLCTANSARSQMAEGFLRALSDGQVEAFSAGSEPQPIHPLAIETMQADWHISLEGQASNHFADYSDQPFDVVVTVCDVMREICPTFPQDTRQLHWSIPDPAIAAEGMRRETFRETAMAIRGRVLHLLHHLRA